MGAEAPEDQAAANAKLVENIDKWMAHFVGDKAFAGGDEPNLADYKAVPFFYAAIQPSMKAKIGLELSEKVVKYCEAFVAKVGAAAMLESHGSTGLHRPQG